VSTTPELVPYENCLRQLTERENVMTRKVGLLKAIDMKMDSISALRTIEKEHGLRVLARRMHEDRTLYNKVMWQLYNERSDIGGAVNELALKLSWGLKWKEKLDAILNERFNLASYLMTNFATNSEKATGKRLELVIEPFFALDEWGAILQDLRVEAQTMEDLYTQNVCTTNS
jgi:hypothetical protein